MRHECLGLQIDRQLGDSERLAIGDNSFNVAIVTFGIIYATDHEAALSELARVVRPGERSCMGRFFQGFGPVRVVAQSLDEDRLAAMRRYVGVRPRWRSV